MKDSDSGGSGTLARIGLVIGIIAGIITIITFLRPPSLGGNAASGTNASSGGTNNSAGQQSTSSQPGGSPTNAPPTNAPPTATPAPPAPGTVLYQANWSGGADGWAASTPWAVVNGNLLNDGSQQTPILAPYQPVTANYAVEATIQVVSQNSSPTFGVFARGSASESLGYVGGIVGYLDADGYNDSAGISVDSIYCPNTPSQCIAFNPGSGWHTYRLEVSGNTVKLYVDGGILLQMTDNSHLDAGQMGLFCSDAQIAVSSFKVTAL